MYSHNVVTHIFAHSGADNVVKIWNPFTGVLIRNLSGHTAGNSDIAWSPDGVFLASASDDTSIRIWDVDSVSLIYTNIHLMSLTTFDARRELRRNISKDTMPSCSVSTTTRMGTCLSQVTWMAR